MLARALLVTALLAPAACDPGPSSAEVATPAPRAATAPAPDPAPAPPASDEDEPADPVAADAPTQKSQETASKDALDLTVLAAYPWLSDHDEAMPMPATTLDRRFPAPAGFARVEVAPGSFGAFLRTLPLAAEGTPVTSYAGGTILRPDHSNLAAVAAIDVGARDLQQCADSIIRLHAEWWLSQGHHDHAYRSASGVDLPFRRYLNGERIVLEGKQIVWKAKGSARLPSHAALRAYLDGVFAWANTGSLAQQAAKITRADLRPGDFFVLPGGPGHAVLILDVARAEDGRVALLLGQGFMPAQSFHVLRPGPAGPWFIVAPADDGVKTPFWETFPWSSLRRLDR